MGVVTVQKSLTPELVRFAILVGVCEMKSQSRRNERKESEIIDDMVFRARSMCMTPEDLRDEPLALAALHQHTVCSQVLAELELIRPLVKVLANR